MTAAVATRKKVEPQAPGMNPRQRRMQERGVKGEDWTSITNFDPNRRYKWIYTGDQGRGPSHYEAMGYVAEVKHSEGVKALFASRRLKDGEEIVVQDHLLMSIDAEQAAEIEQYGEFGNGGLELVKRLELEMTGGRNPRTSNRRAVLPDGHIDQDYFAISRNMHEL
jgi:hypothetical protein